MTIETKTTIELSDIQALEYVCAKCGSSTTRKLNDSHKVPFMCGNCGDVWMTEGSREGAEMRAFVNTLRAMAELNNEHFRLRLNVTGVEGKK